MMDRTGVVWAGTNRGLFRLQGERFQRVDEPLHLPNIAFFAIRESADGQLFAAGWSACFLSAMKLVAGKKKISLPADAAIDAEVDLGTTHGGFGLAARLNVSLPGMDRQAAQATAAN